MTEEMDNIHSSPNNNVTPKGKKKRNSGKFCSTKLLTSDDKPDPTPVSSPCTFQFNFSTPEIQKAKSAPVNGYANDDIGVNKIGVGYPQEKSYSEAYNTSMVDDESEAPPKKKKKKRNDPENFIHQEILDESNISLNCSASEGNVSEKKKKKKRNDPENSINGDVLDESNISLNCSAIEGDVSEKKKKKKRNDPENSIHENVLDESNISLHCSEKKKKVHFDDSILQEREIDDSILDSNLDMPHKKKKKKKKEKLEESFDYSFNDEQTLDKTLEEESEVPHKKKRKRQESESSSINEEIDDTHEITMEEDTASTKNKHKQDLEQSDLAVKMDEYLKMFNQEEDGNAQEDNQNENHFTMLKRMKGVRKSRVKRVLPEWLANPTRVNSNLSEVVPVKSLAGLDSYFMKTLHETQIFNFFPIQTAVIPELLTSSKNVSMRYRPRDVCISAPTGSGKTLTYVLPILQTLIGRVVPRLRALVILPTQELAKQVWKVFQRYAKRLNLEVFLATGSSDMTQEKEKLMSKGPLRHCSFDIMIATLGRLTDHMNFTKGLDFTDLRFLVLDEADLFLSSSGGSMMLQLESIKKKLNISIPNNDIICGGFQSQDSIQWPQPYLQQILVSATLMHNPEQLKILNLHQPKLFISENCKNKKNVNTKKNVNAKENSETEESKPAVESSKKTVIPYTRPQELTEEFVMIDPKLKPLALHYLINLHKLRRVLVFTKSVMATKTLSIVLSTMANKYTVAKFSSEEKNRSKILKDFVAGNIDILITSDAMARGLDIDDVKKVVSYDVPSLQTYVHRIGRTGRAGKEGYALSIVEDTEQSKRDFKQINNSGNLKQIKMKEKSLKQFEILFEKALATLKLTLKQEKRISQETKRKNIIEKVKQQRIKKKLKS